MAGAAGVAAAGPARPGPAARRRRRPGPRAAVHRPGHRHPGRSCGSSSRTPRWRCSTGCTGPRSPARSGDPAAAGRPRVRRARPARRCGCGPWPTCSPTPPPRASTLRIDGTEVQVRRPRAGRPGRRAFVSGKKKQNTIKATAISDARAALLWLGAFRPGRMHDVRPRCAPTASKTCSAAVPHVKAEVDAGYRGLATRLPRPGQRPAEETDATTPRPRRPPAWERQRHQQSSQRICVEHAIAEHKQWRALQRYIGRREYFHETVLAIAGLVSDRAADAVTTHSQPARPARARP